MSSSKTQKKDFKPADFGAAGEISEDFDKFELWFAEHSKAIIIICVAVILLIGAAVAVHSGIKANERKVNAAFANAVTAEEIQAVLAQNPSGVFAAEARLRLAGDFVKNKDYKKAAEQYRLAAEEPAAVPFVKYRALLNSAYAFEMDGNVKGALSIYEKTAGSQDAPEDMKLEAFYGAGRMALLENDGMRARAAFKRAAGDKLNKTDAIIWTALAKSALDRLPAEQKAVPAAK